MKIRYLLFLSLMFSIAILPGVQSSAKADSVILDENHSLHSLFHDFAKARVQIINKNFVHTPENLYVGPSETLFVARYHQVDPATITIQVKKTNSGRTPYIGILSYRESVYESNGGCNASVAQGPFAPVRHRDVTEIFRYVQNRWQ
ncbi:hypothetical protein [Desulfonatronovibrio magnus]|uniref:hypothetical protein n=1 Tax=Desulfonatronovibrio magnus TaxID=698827 RepID=UPI000696B316|nr:hypothetical protein [Desulfonatronovibrio magnus]